MPPDGGDDDVDDEQGPEYVCGADTANTDEPCQFPVDGPDERCHNHPADGSGPPEGTGSGDPGHRMGDGDGKIQERLPENAKPNMKHGLNAVQDDPHGTMTWLEDNDPRGFRWVRDKWRSYMVNADFPGNSGQADDVLHACLMLYAVRAVRHRQIQNGLTGWVEHYTDQGQRYEVEEEVPSNLPANRIAREARSILKDCGVLDDPESAKADAMGGWGDAAREVARNRDDADDVDEPEVIEHA